nr:MAG TPA: hypothetical protein [Caudoviricetes sp.]
MYIPHNFQKQYQLILHYSYNLSPYFLSIL